MPIFDNGIQYIIPKRWRMSSMSRRRGEDGEGEERGDREKQKKGGERGQDGEGEEWKQIDTLDDIVY